MHQVQSKALIKLLVRLDITPGLMPNKYSDGKLKRTPCLALSNKLLLFSPPVNFSLSTVSLLVVPHTRTVLKFLSIKFNLLSYVVLYLFFLNFSRHI